MPVIGQVVQINGSRWYNTTTTPATGTGSVGDYHINTTTGDFYEKTATSTWTQRGNLKGTRGYNPRGAFTPNTLYQVDDTVTNEGSTYRRIIAGTSGANFVENPNWEAVARAGVDGDPGVSGTGVVSYSIKKAADTSRNVAATSADPDLRFPVGTNEIWDISLMVFFTGDLAGDLKFTFTAPAGSTLNGSAIGVGPNVAGNTTLILHTLLGATGPSYTVGALGASTPTSLIVSAQLDTAGTPGEFVFHWAQGTLNAGVPTVVDSNSNMVAAQN